ncbi:hypothetical protein EYF80_006822 [Liparis tanakae]|uniref:Uncharacterized protein n=1 Tax=Liparis tanakae TaxID=230148 RepID=A0A4Z2IY11_9TELE|nr:hypothetical protein EYF80_006822 [Liparis tanakae]
MLWPWMMPILTAERTAAFIPAQGAPTFMMATLMLLWLTTQAGVSCLASSSAITASTPILLPCGPHTRTHTHLISFDEVTQQPAPLVPELVGSSQTAVASDHAQVGDAELHQVAGCLHTTLSGLEVLAAGAADDGAALTSEEDKTLVALQHTVLEIRPYLMNKEDFGAGVETNSDCGSHSSVHT